MTRSSRQRGEMVCTVCKTKTSPLWRRGDKGEVLCNACGLYHKHHKKPRPISLANSSARSVRRSSHQNNENKVQNQRYQNIYPNNMRPNFPFNTTIAPALTAVNATGSTLKSNPNMSPTLQPNLFTTTGALNTMNLYATTANVMNTLSTVNLSPTFKMTTPISTTLPIPIKKPNSSSVTSPPLSNSFSPPYNIPLLKNNNNNNQTIKSSRMSPSLPAPFIQKNNSEHYYNNNCNLPSLIKREEDNGLKPMDMDARESMNSDEENKYSSNVRNSKTSIASITNSIDTPINSYNQNRSPSFNNYTPLPTPLSASPSNYNSNDNDQDDGMYDHQDIEAANLLISLRNCEKVC